MPLRSPRQIQSQFRAAFNKDDTDESVELYEPGAVVIPQPGHEARGKDQIRDALNEFLAPKGQMVFDTILTLEKDDLACLVGKWSLSGTGPDGNPITLGSMTAEVVRRPPDGTWLYVIDNEWGETATG